MIGVLIAVAALALIVAGYALGRATPRRGSIVDPVSPMPKHITSTLPR